MTVKRTIETITERIDRPIWERRLTWERSILGQEKVFWMPPIYPGYITHTTSAHTITVEYGIS